MKIPKGVKITYRGRSLSEGDDCPKDLEPKFNKIKEKYSAGKKKTDESRVKRLSEFKKAKEKEKNTEKEKADKLEKEKADKLEKEKAEKLKSGANSQTGNS